MHGDYARHRFQMLAHLIEIQPLRGLLQQYTDGVVQQFDCAGDHHQCDDAARDRVELIPAGCEHDQGGCDHGYRTQCVVHHFKERGLHIHIVAALRGKNGDGDDVGHQPQYADEQQKPNIADRRFGIAEQSHACLEQRVDAHEQQHQRTACGGDDLKPCPTPGAGAVGFAAHQYGGDGRGDQYGNISEHMPGVGEQRQRIGDERRHDLDDEHGDGDGQCRHQPLLIPLDMGGGMRMRHDLSFRQSR